MRRLVFFGKAIGVSHKPGQAAAPRSSIAEHLCDPRIETHDTAHRCRLSGAGGGRECEHKWKSAPSDERRSKIFLAGNELATQMRVLRQRVLHSTCRTVASI